jgi:hypothetical protein
VEDRFPLRQAAPSWSWLPGEVLRDAHTLPLDRAIPLPDTLLVIVYDAETVAEVGRWSVVLPQN